MPRDFLTLLKEDPSDEASWAELYQQMRPWVYSICFKWLGKFDDAEDATQATFMHLARQWRQTEFPGWPQLRKYLKKTAISRSIDLLRQRKASRSPEALSDTVLGMAALPGSGRSSETPEELLDYLDLTDVQRAQISNREQQILWLSYLGYTNQEIAEQVGVTDRTIRRDLHVLRHLLRQVE